MSSATMARDLERACETGETTNEPTFRSWESTETIRSVPHDEEVMEPNEEVMEPTVDRSPDEKELIKLCLLRDPNAWQTLFQTYQPRLLSLIKLMLGSKSDTEQAEEIASAVWLVLCGEGYSRLRQYESGTGRLLTYLAVLARHEIWRARRSERSRVLRESRVARNEATRDEVSRGLDLSEFLTTLTRREREFCLRELLEPHNSSDAPSFSTTNGWQLRCRILKKFRAYFLREKFV